MRPHLLMLMLVGVAFALAVLAGAGRATSDSGAGMFGDVDCDQKVSAVDALALLRYTAGLPASQREGCLAVGSHNELPVPTATATPQPRGPIAHCWMAAVGYAVMNPGTLGTSADCHADAPDSPAYDCTIYLLSQTVICDGSTQWPSYRCDYFAAKDIRCQTFSNSFPDYTCSMDAAHVNCKVDSSVSLVDGPAYECALTAAEVSCRTASPFYPDFACAREGARFQCHYIFP